MKKESKVQQSLVSVCVITYNHANYIEDAINGVICQKTNFPYDIIISDDNSSDGTINILKNYKQKHSKQIKLIFNKNNLGPHRNFINLITKPKTKYIAYVEGDDYWTDPYKLQKQVDFLENNEEYSLCASRYRHVDENSNIIGEGPTLDPLRIDQHNERFRQFENFTLADYLSYPYNIFQYSSVLFRNIDDITFGMDKGIYGGDLVLSINLLKKGRAYYFLDDYFSTYRIHANGVWNKNGKLKKAKIKVADYKKLKILYSEYSEEINKILKCKYNELSIEYARNGDILKSFYNYLLSLPNDSEYINDSGFRRFFKLIFNIKENYSRN